MKIKRNKFFIYLTGIFVTVPGIKTVLANSFVSKFNKGTKIVVKSNPLSVSRKKQVK